MAPWEDTFTEQLGEDIFIDQQQWTLTLCRCPVKMSAHQVVRDSWRRRSRWRREKVCRQGCGRAGRRRCWARAVRAAIGEEGPFW